jgi:Spy/CpxP family protein refolding chaperone
MNKVLFLTIGIVLLFLLNAGMLIYLFRLRAFQHELRGRGAGDFIVEQLHLNEQQQRAFAQLRRRHHETVRQAQEEDRHLHDVYFTLLKTDHPDKARADSVASLIAAQRAVIEKATFDHFEQLRNLCNGDQKKLFDETIDEIARHMAPPQHERPEGPPPPP